MNSTITNFGYPDTLIQDYPHWVVLLRPAQATLGAVILACKEDALAFGEISSTAGAELPGIVKALESALSTAFGYTKLNYLMLMMVDPHVHFHVLPRYDKARTLFDVEFVDPGWPGPPQITAATPTEPATNQALVALLQEHWPKA